MGKYKGMEKKILFELLIMVIVIVGVSIFLFLNFQGDFLPDFQNNTELQSACNLWNCEEPIPTSITTGLGCASIEDCKSECKRKGALMLKCK